MKQRTQRPGFTLVELLVVIAIIGVLVGLLLPAVQAAREAARRMSCSNNFKQIGLGLHNYHSAYKKFPAAAGGTWSGNNGNNLEAHNNWLTNGNRLSGLVAILPFIEQQALWEQFSNPWAHPTNGNVFAPMGPIPASANGVGRPVQGNTGSNTEAYNPQRTQVVGYRCPSDPLQLGGQGQTNYAFCYGDGTRYIRFPYGRHGFNDTNSRDDPAKRGVFHPGYQFKFRDILDGTAHTIAMGEIGVGGSGKREVVAYLKYNVQNAVHQNPAFCRTGAVVDPLKPTKYLAGTLSPRGRMFAFGQPVYTGINTVLPPNSPSCGTDNSANPAHGVFSAGSYHQGGAHVLMGDGAVKFITESVDAGDSTSPSVSGAGGVYVQAGSESPYGLWGALGSRDGEETKSLED